MKIKTLNLNPKVPSQPKAKPLRIWRGIAEIQTIRPKSSTSSWIGFETHHTQPGIGLLPKLSTHRILPWIPDSNNPFGFSRFRIPTILSVLPIPDSVIVVVSGFVLHLKELAPASWALISFRFSHVLINTNCQVNVVLCLPHGSSGQEICVATTHYPYFCTLVPVLMQK